MYKSILYKKYINTYIDRNFADKMGKYTHEETKRRKLLYEQRGEVEALSKEKRQAGLFVEAHEKKN